MRWIYRLLAVITIGPFFVWLGCLITMVILGTVYDCKINEGSVQPCIVAGRDVGAFAYTMGLMAAWGVLILGPISFCGGALWGLTAIGHRIWLRRANRRPPPQ